MKIVENMSWPPSNVLTYKMEEHSAWYSGEIEILSNFYGVKSASNIFGNGSHIGSSGMFWGRQHKNRGNVLVHVPVAGDIAETSANFLFSESPTIKIAEANEEKASQSFKDTQTDVDALLMDNGFYKRIMEAAEACAAIGGVFVKIAWDEDLAPYPIPVVVQADKAIPEFKFGILTAVTFWKVVQEDRDGNKVFRLLERYEKGRIIYTLYEGTADRLGYKIDLDAFEETKDLEEVVKTVDALLVVYVPNVLPNRIDRGSYLGRSDLSGIERLMDSLDETFSCWTRDIMLAKGKVMVPESFMGVMDKEGNSAFDIEQTIYVKLDMDPTIEGFKITPVQFAIRAEEFEKTSKNILERIVTAAGYSPQSFGLNIEGRAESGTALSMRERKSFSTKGKKENYWQPALRKLVQLMMLVYNDEFGAKLELNCDVNISFNDGITNDLSELSNSVKMISDAIAASTDTKVRLLHPDWNEDQIKAEVEKITKENNLGTFVDPDKVGTRNEFEE